jgi:2-keto-4-pentenoate hydratase/2-oxohepta-3-ene-1,7-dioic acid hydratase in catechol pathway
MRLVTYSIDGMSWRPGIRVDGVVADTASAAAKVGLTGAEVMSLRTNRDVLSLDAVVLNEIGAAAGESGVETHDHAVVRLGPPVPDPQKIVCLGLNYFDHAEEAGLTAPATPIFFAKFANSLAGPYDDVIPPRTTERVDYEAELAVVIGRPARRVEEADALDYVAGAMVLNDVSARDLQLANNLWMGGKAIDTFAPCGPSLVLMDEVSDLQDLRVSTRVNGELRQDGTTASMIFGVAATISFLSEIMTLQPGDVIATGTPAGVGAFKEPPVFLKTGDMVETEVEGLGILRNRLAAPVE